MINHLVQLGEMVHGVWSILKLMSIKNIYAIMCLPFKIYNQVRISIMSSAGKCTLNTDWLNSSWQDERGKGETLVLGSSRSLDCGGLIHNTSCPSPPGQQMAVWMFKCFLSFCFFVSFQRQRGGSISRFSPRGNTVRSPPFLIFVTSVTAVEEKHAN